jgi:hypothetical protein
VWGCQLELKSFVLASSFATTSAKLFLDRVSDVKDAYKQLRIKFSESLLTKSSYTMASSIFFACVLACLAASFAQASDFVDLWTFDGKKSSTFGWKLVNDPVMGGLSNSTFKVNKTSMTAVWDGEVRIVPSLDAPGFCNVETSDWPATFNDASSYDALVIKARAFNDYTGYKVSFGAEGLNPRQYGEPSFKAPFNLTGDGEWHHVTLPWTDFSDDWSGYTGDCFTKDPNGQQHVCCTPDTPDVCPTQKNLKHITQIGLWTEGGIPGKFNIEVEWVRAYVSSSKNDDR